MKIIKILALTLYGLIRPSKQQWATKKSRELAQGGSHEEKASE